EELAYQRFVAGPAPGLVQQDEPEWRGVYGPIVGDVRNLSRSRELAAAKFVHDLPRLLLGGLVHRGTLRAREVAERVRRHARVEGERLERDDDRVAAEGSRIPGNAGGYDREPVRLGVQRADVGDRVVERRV